MSDAVDKNMAGLRSSQALPIFSLFNSSSLLPDPASLVTHYRSVADGVPLTQQKTGWNCVHVRVCLRETERVNQAAKTNILLKLLSTMNFDVNSCHWSGIPPVKTFWFFFFYRQRCLFLSHRELVQSCWGRRRKKTNAQQTISTQSHTYRYYILHEFAPKGRAEPWIFVSHHSMLTLTFQKASFSLTISYRPNLYLLDLLNVNAFMQGNDQFTHFWTLRLFGQII